MRAFRVGSSQRSCTLTAVSALATSGHTVVRRDVCTRRFSAALQADG